MRSSALRRSKSRFIVGGTTPVGELNAGRRAPSGQRSERHDLHRRTLQLMRTNRSAPLGPVIPELAYPNVGAAVDWLVGVLGFVERVRIGPGHRAQLSFGEGSLIVADVGHGRSAPTGEESSQSVMLRVDDVAALCDRVRKHGGEIVREPRDYSYGERQCTIRDPAGHRWTLTQTLHDVAPEEWGGITVDAQ